MSSNATPSNFDQVNQSAFRLYSIGIVAQNKELDSVWIEATPVEDTMNLDGELTDHIYDFKSQGRDYNGSNYQTEVKTAATIKCKWLALGQGNRMTAPDVRRGDKVQIYRMANSNQFFWETIGNDSNTRRLETVVNAYSATKKEDETLNDENSYTQGVSTHKKLVTIIHTTMANEEKYSYDIYVDTGNDNIMIKDNVGNFITLNSQQTLIHIHNMAGSEVKMSKGDITINAPSSMTINTPNYTLNAPSITMNGQTQHNGNINVNGGIQTTGDVKAGSVSLKEHTHTNRGSGRPNQ